MLSLLLPVLLRDALKYASAIAVAHGIGTSSGWETLSGSLVMILMSAYSAYTKTPNKLAADANATGSLIVMPKASVDRAAGPRTPSVP